MPEVVTTIASIITIFNFVHQVQNDEVDVFINGNQVAQQVQTAEKIIDKGEERREQILFAANERREYILSQTTLR